MFSHLGAKASVFLLVLFICFSVPSGTIHAQENDYRKALGLISGKLHQRFPNLRGSVVAVKGADLYLSLGEKDEVVKGVKLGVYREGAPFRHPATGVVLGRLEEEVGEAEVVEVREKFSIARLTRLAPGGRLSPRVNDTVRMSAVKVRLAILPFVNQTKEAVSMETLTRELGRQLVRSGRFDVYDVDRLQVWLLETGIATDEILKSENPIRLRNQVRGDMALENELREIRGKKILSTRLLSLTTKEELFKAVAIADELPFEQGPPKEQELIRGEGERRAGPANESFVLVREGAPGRAGGVKSYSLGKSVCRGVSVADVDGDGKNEVVLITQTQVIVYNFEANQMREVARFDGGAANDFRWLDIADMNGDGAPEFYLASYRSNELFSMVLQLKGGKFAPLVRNDRTFYRLVRIRRPKRGEKIPDSEAFLLLGQSEGLEKAFDGPIRSYRWSGGKLAPAAFALPPDLTILGFGLWDINKDGALEVIEVGKDDRLRVFSRSGADIFSGSESYGVPVHKFFSLANTENTSDRIHTPDLPIRSRVLVEDVDRDGVDEVLVIKNEYAAAIAPGLGVSRGQIASLIWDGSGLTEVWRSRKLGRGIVDFAFGDADNDGSNDLVVAATSTSLLAGSKSQIFLYRLRE
ncbi:MAG: FG-GAP-like repeat-containing protein [Nitrospinae bacterium]|nr:FG-GAP-like repeat-containing protein [Nitrospinota bacterium]